MILYITTCNNKITTAQYINLIKERKHDNKNKITCNIFDIYIY